MKCNRKGCEKDAVTFHGVTQTTHGYCEDHRCCRNCGLQISDCIEGNGCGNPIERQDYLEWKQMKDAENSDHPNPPQVIDQVKRMIMDKVERIIGAPATEDVMKGFQEQLSGVLAGMSEHGSSCFCQVRPMTMKDVYPRWFTRCMARLLMLSFKLFKWPNIRVVNKAKWYTTVFPYKHTRTVCLDDHKGLLEQLEETADDGYEIDITQHVSVRDEWELVDPREMVFAEMNVKFPRPVEYVKLDFGIKQEKR